MAYPLKRYNTYEQMLTTNMFNSQLYDQKKTKPIAQGYPIFFIIFLFYENSPYGKVSCEFCLYK